MIKNDTECWVMDLPIINKSVLGNTPDKSSLSLWTEKFWVGVNDRKFRYFGYLPNITQQTEFKKL